MKSLYGKITAFILLAGVLSACGTQAAGTPASQPSEVAAQPIAQNTTISFTKDVLPILQSRCVNCHGGERVSKGLTLKTYNDLMTGSENGPVVTVGKATDSLLVEMIVSQKMPKNGPKLTPQQVQLITEWVNQGALNN